jgi:adenine-specific DNA-methyltransferase
MSGQHLLADLAGPPNVRARHHAHPEQAVTKVFVGGSRRISRLNVDVRQRLDKIIEKQLPVLIGDANGVDRAVQRYLHEQRYAAVEVFSADEHPRNNVGAWSVRVVRPESGAKGFDHYAAKDRAMAEEGTVGLMIWDGESRGTLLNALRLIRKQKPVVVYLSPDRTFTEVRTGQDLERLVSRLDRAATRRFRDQAESEGLYEAEAQATQLHLGGLP